MCLYFLLYDNFVDKEPSDIDVKRTETDIHSEVPNNIEEIATDIPPEVKESEESEVMESGEIWSIIAKIARIAEKTKIILGSFFLRT